MKFVAFVIAPQTASPQLAVGTGARENSNEADDSKFSMMKQVNSEERNVRSRS